MELFTWYNAYVLVFWCIIVAGVNIYLLMFVEWVWDMILSYIEKEEQK